MIKYKQIMFLFYLFILLLLILRTEKVFLPIFEIASADTILFWDGYEAGQDSSGNFINWDETPVYGGAGIASAIDDTIIYYEGHHSARFELTNGAQGGWAYTNKIIPWTIGKKLWYSCYLRNGPRSQSNVTVGGLYFMEAYIIHPSGYRERANIETHPYEGLPDSLFMLRMAYRGRDGQRHRQYDNLQFLRREQWHHITMLVDLSGSEPLYAWWLNNSLIWYEYDTSSGTDTLAPTEFHTGACWIDWGEGNRGLVWVDNCQVADFGPGVGIEQENKDLNDAGYMLSIYPNPCSKSTTLSIMIQEKTNLMITVYDLAGREMLKFTDNKVYPNGKHRIQLNLNRLQQGVYFLKLSTRKTNFFKKIILLNKL